MLRQSFRLIRSRQRRQWLRPRLRHTALLLVQFAGASALAQGQPGRITVAEGDTLEQLAERHGVSLEALIRLNGIQNPELLQVGQVLLLPGSTGGASIAPPPPGGRAARPGRMEVACRRGAHHLGETGGG